MRALLARLGNPQHRLRIVHVAGTKGKGSTSAMLAAILRRAGYRTGLFTSPHLCRVEERFQVDGAADHRGRADRAAERGPRARGRPPQAEPITFFEVATAVGFLHFVRRRVDAAVVEVGLGGRFDSTNVCRPAVAVITSISLDHTQQLGDRLAQHRHGEGGHRQAGPAGAERRDGAGGAAGDRTHLPRARCAAAPARRRFPLRLRAGPRDAPRATGRPRVRVATRRRAWPWMELNLLGEHQAANAARGRGLRRAAARRRAGTIPDAAVAAGLAATDWPARMEVVGRRPLVVLDCAHNVASAEALVRDAAGVVPAGPPPAGLRRQQRQGPGRHVPRPGPHFAHAFLTRVPRQRRSTPPERLAELLRAAGGPPATRCAAPAAAWEAARAVAGPDDLICVTGSVFLAGEMRSILASGRREPAGVAAPETVLHPQALAYTSRLTPAARRNLS